MAPLAPKTFNSSLPGGTALFSLPCSKLLPRSSDLLLLCCSLWMFQWTTKLALSSSLMPLLKGPFSRSCTHSRKAKATNRPPPPKVTDPRSWKEPEGLFAQLTIGWQESSGPDQITALPEVHRRVQAKTTSCPHPNRNRGTDNNKWQSVIPFELQLFSNKPVLNFYIIYLCRQKEKCARGELIYSTQATSRLRGNMYQ